MKQKKVTGSLRRACLLMIVLLGLVSIIASGGGGGGGGGDKSDGDNTNGDTLSDYDGSYYGTYAGDESGDWCMDIVDGEITGLAWDSFGELYSLSGTVSLQGEMVVGSADDNTRFTGTITNNGVMSGTWTYTPDPGENGTYDGQKGDCPYGDTAEIENVQAVIKTVTKAADEGGQATESVETTNDPSVGIPVDDVLQADSFLELFNALVNITACGTFTRSSNTLVYTISGGQTCELKSGTITVSNIQITNGTINVTLTFDDVVTTTCTLDGKADVQLTENGVGQLIFTASLTNFKTCNGTIDGDVTGVYEAATVSFVSGTAVFRATYTENGESVQINVNLDYDAADGINGTADATVGGTNYHCVLADVVIDKTCGIPTSGTITVTSNTLSSAVVFDFSNTTCANPTVMAVVEGQRMTFTL